MIGLARLSAAMPTAAPQHYENARSFLQPPRRRAVTSQALEKAARRCREAVPGSNFSAATPLKLHVQVRLAW